MQENDVLKIAIAETSMIIRSGLALVLKRLQGWKVLPIEVETLESLQECMQYHRPEVLIINPAFHGAFDVRRFREEERNAGVKCVALISSVVSQPVLQQYDAMLTVYDDAEMIREKLGGLLAVPEEEETAEVASDQEALSSREKEIVIGVVKGLTNKEIADTLCLSAHTVTTHRRNIARKLQIHSPAGLTIYAIVNKLVELQDIKEYL